MRVARFKEEAVVSLVDWKMRRAIDALEAYREMPTHKQRMVEAESAAAARKWLKGRKRRKPRKLCKVLQFKRG